MRTAKKAAWQGLFAVAAFASCTPAKNIAYFQDLRNTPMIYSQALKENYEVTIRHDDIVQILINSINSEATAIFNLGNTALPPVSGVQILSKTTSFNVSSVALSAPS